MSPSASRAATSSSSSSDIGHIVQRRAEQFEKYTGLTRPQHHQLIELGWEDVEPVSEEPLGRGTFSCVHEVYYQGQTFALKQLDPYAYGRSEKHFKRGAIDLVLESQLISHLDHPNIIKIHGVKKGPIRDSVNSATEPYFLMLDYLEDTLEGMLHKWKREESPLTKIKNKMGLAHDTAVMNRVEKVAMGIVRGMEYLHENNVIFRDLKPQNVGITHDGTVKIFDFGVSRDMEHVRRAGDKLGFTGTPRYMANEVGGGEKYGLAVDVYSFGILLWEICTLRQPFSRMRSLDHYKQSVVVNGQRPNLSYVKNRRLRKLISRCWDGDASARPTFTEVREELEYILAEHSSGIWRRNLFMVNTKDQAMMESATGKHEAMSDMTETTRRCSLRFEDMDYYELTEGGKM